MNDSAMQLAREYLVTHLAEPRTYRVGKFTTIRRISPGERQVVLDLKGRGVLKRLWTAHSPEADCPPCVRLSFHVDDRPDPVLGGLAHQIAQAASQVSCPRIPLGGYQDGFSTSLYLPIAFSQALRIEASVDTPYRDGVYWQIDYALDTEETWPPPRQTCGPDGEMVISYDLPPDPPAVAPRRCRERVEEFSLSGASPKTLWLDGPAIIRRIEISSESIDSLLLRMAFDGPVPDAEGRCDGPFQVDAPLRYLVGPFVNACVEQLGSKVAIHFPMPFRTRMALQILAAMECGSFHGQHRTQVRIAYEPDPPPIDRPLYFHARFHQTVTNGRDDFECCSTAGRGHFVGVHLFDTGHDHGGGDNILFDSGTPRAGQLHGICGEDYFHMAYMRVWQRVPYAGCPRHSARYRYHIEMPVPFQESFVFNWGTFASQPAKAVAFWYQDVPAAEDPPRELTYEISGPFPLDVIDRLVPDAALPSQAAPFPGFSKAVPPAVRWRKSAQRGFVDLCHIHRRYLWPVPPSTGCIPYNVCAVAQTAVFAHWAGPAVLRVGCDDPIRVYLNGQKVFSDEGRQHPDPFRAFDVPVNIQAGLNRLFIVAADTYNSNWCWNGFSLVILFDRSRGDILYLS